MSARNHPNAAASVPAFVRPRTTPRTAMIRLATTAAPSSRRPIPMPHGSAGRNRVAVRTVQRELGTDPRLSRLLPGGLPGGRVAAPRTRPQCPVGRHGLLVRLLEGDDP